MNNRRFKRPLGKQIANIFSMKLNMNLNWNLNGLFTVILLLFTATKGHSDPLVCRDLLQNSTSATAETDGLIAGRYEYVFDNVRGFNNHSNPYDHPFNTSQKEFLEDFGVRFTPNSVIIPSVHELALRVNAHIDQMIESGEVKASEVFYWSDGYIKDKKLVFVKYGDPAPEDAVPFTEEGFEIEEVDLISGQTLYVPKGTNPDENTPAYFLFSHLDFNLAVSQGFLPVARSHRNFNLEPQKVPESSLLHDLGHLGGFIVNPEMMAFFRRVSKKLLAANHPEAPSTVFADINEKLLLVGDGNQAFPIASAEIDFSSEGTLWDSLERLSSEELESVLDEVIEKYPSLRHPMGGALRTGSFSVNLRVPLDNEYLDLVEVKSGHEQGYYYSDYYIKHRLVVFFRVYYLMAGLTLEDYELATGLGPRRVTDRLEQLAEIWGYLR